MIKKFIINDQELDVEILKQTATNVSFNIDNMTYNFNKMGQLASKIILQTGTNLHNATIANISKDTKHFVENNQDIFISVPSKNRKKSNKNEAGYMVSPMPGKIFKIIKKVGDNVDMGQTILIMEAMKMEHPIKANCKGVIKEIFYNEGDLVDGGIELIILDEIKE